MTPKLSQTLVADVYSLLNNHKPDLRRRACLCLYKCFLRYPEALRNSFARCQCLDDEDQSVVQAAVTVLSELAMHNPKTYLPLAPKFYKLLTSSSSNWMTIKLVKVFGQLTPLEPRLAKKLAGPIGEILETTNAKSLMYECVRTVVMGMTSQEKVVRQAVDKLKDMLEDRDPNIKFSALHALTFLLDSHPRIVAEHKGNIFECLDHEDSNIQYCALKIVCGLVTKRTLIDPCGRRADELDGQGGSTLPRRARVERGEHLHGRALRVGHGLCVVPLRPRRSHSRAVLVSASASSADKSSMACACASR